MREAADGAIRHPDVHALSMPTPTRHDGSSDAGSGDHDLDDLLHELRVLLPGAQTLTAFLVILFFR